MQVTFLGTSAARPTVERNVSSICIAREGETLMFDCGEGTQRQMMRFGVSFTLSEIFVTHYHADHYLGIGGLLRTLSLQGRTEPMTLYGPKGAERLLRRSIELGVERIAFEVDVKELKSGDRLKRAAYDIVVFPVKHGRDALGYALVEHKRLGRFDPGKAIEMGIPEGPLWGRLHRGETVKLPDGRDVGAADLVGPPRSGRKVVYTGDTRPSEEVVKIADGADLLIHDSTFGAEEADRAAETDHSTAVEAAQIALSARAKRLILNHLSARYSKDFQLLLDQAREVFPETLVAKDGMKIDVAYSD
ncbi:MAG: ribonuclease Z [Gemmatimonadetes bacterium]|nr:ribonuclease Z [Gemmatimonadota bacterium]